MKGFVSKCNVFFQTVFVRVKQDWQQRHVFWYSILVMFACIAMGWFASYHSRAEFGDISLFVKK